MKKDSKNTKTAAAAAATANKPTFSDILRQYEKTAKDRQQRQTAETETAYINALYTLAAACAYSVIKKCIRAYSGGKDTEKASANFAHIQTLMNVKKSIAKDLKSLASLQWASANAYTLTTNKNGDTISTVYNANAVTVLESTSRETLGDGIDLVQTAVTAILAETEKAMTAAADRVEFMLISAKALRTAKGKNRRVYIKAVKTCLKEIAAAENFMESVYTIRVLNRKVWIKTEDSIGGWTTKEIAPIQQVFKAVRRDIENSSTKSTDTRNGYSYIADLAIDSDSGNVETIYRRLPKYADIGGKVTDFNGKEIAYTADEKIVSDSDKILESLNLSTRQSKVLKLRCSGYGYKAIGTYLGIDHSNVVRVCRQIQKKAAAVGFTFADYKKTYRAKTADAKSVCSKIEKVALPLPEYEISGFTLRKIDRSKTNFSGEKIVIE